MINHYPFHYEVRFKLLALDSNNNVRIESFTNKFEGENPIENRIKAFEAFDEYLSYLKIHNRVLKNKQGNYVITKPTLKFINNSNEDNQDISDKIDYNNFQEDISVVLVIDDDIVLKSFLNEDYAQIKTEFDDIFIELIKSEFVIHKIASYEIDSQDLIDNLESKEMKLYDFYSINIDDIKTTVYHYGVDYGESGEDIESGAKRTIIPTPFIWNTLEDYNERIALYTTSETNNSFDLKSIIECGESNSLEFKSSLLYNFKTHKSDNLVKYIIAKSICGFLNSNGGLLLIGIRDNGKIQGLNYDYSLFEDADKPQDKLLLEVDALLNIYFGITIMPYITTRIIKVDNTDILMIIVQESRKPVFLIKKTTDKTYKEFYVRMNASTRQIYDLEEITEYVFNKKWNKT